MKKTGAMFLLIGLLFGLAGGGLFSELSRANAESVAQFAVIEYATCTFSPGLGISAFNSPDGDYPVSVGSYDLYQQLGGTVEQSKFDNSDLLIQIGLQGWELVLERRIEGTNIIYWIFKRV